MGVLQTFEKRLAGLVEGAFAKVFKGSVEPVEIAKALAAEADGHAVVSANRTLIPNSFLVELGPRDYDRLAPYSEALGTELSAMVREHADEHRYSFVGPVTVALGHDGTLDTGVFRVHAEVSADGAYTPQSDQPAAPAATPAPPAPAPTPEAAPAPPLDILRPAPTPPRPASVAPARLHFEDGRALDLVAAVTRIGRSREADLRLDDGAVSRQHAEIRRDTDGSHVLVDLGSTNGTLVDGEKVSSMRLVDGARVSIGATTLTYRSRQV